MDKSIMGGGSFAGVTSDFCMQTGGWPIIRNRVTATRVRELRRVAAI